MSDILQTLRFKERSASYEMAPICKRAADEIARLRAALSLFSKGDCPFCHADCAGANPPVTVCPMKEANDALRVNA